MVAERKVAVGDVAQPGQALAALYDPDRLQIEGEVNDNYREQVKIGEIAQVSVPAVKFEAGLPIAEIFPISAPGSRTFKVRTEMVKNPALMPGMFARLALPLGRSRGLLIPKAAVHTVGQLTMVKVAVEKTAQLRQVKLGQAVGDKVEVLAGLKPGRPDYIRRNSPIGAACGRRNIGVHGTPYRRLLVPKLLLGNAIARQAPLGRPQMGRNPMGGAKQSFAAREVPKQELGNQKNRAARGRQWAHSPRYCPT